MVEAAKRARRENVFAEAVHDVLLVFRCPDCLKESRGSAGDDLPFPVFENRANHREVVFQECHLVVRCPVVLFVFRNRRDFPSLTLDSYLGLVIMFKFFKGGVMFDSRIMMNLNRMRAKVSRSVRGCEITRDATILGTGYVRNRL